MDDRNGCTSLLLSLSSAAARKSRRAKARARAVCMGSALSLGSVVRRARSAQVREGRAGEGRARGATRSLALAASLSRAWKRRDTRFAGTLSPSSRPPARHAARPAPTTHSDALPRYPLLMPGRFPLQFTRNAATQTHRPSSRQMAPRHRRRPTTPSALILLPPRPPRPPPTPPPAGMAAVAGPPSPTRAGRRPRPSGPYWA
jgi:hypothetical protein